MNNKGILNVAAVAIAVLIFLIVMQVYGQLYASQLIVSNRGTEGVTTVLFNGTFSTGVINLVQLIPLVLVGAAIIGIIVVAFKMSQ